MKNTLPYILLALISSTGTLAIASFYENRVRTPALRDSYELEAVQTGYAQFNPKTKAFEWKRSDLLADELFIKHPVGSLFPLPTK